MLTARSSSTSRAFRPKSTMARKVNASASTARSSWRQETATALSASVACASTAARAFQVPTRQLESPDEAYFERIGFDGWDVLYTENEFFSAVSNTETHVVSGILRAPGATRARVQLATVDKKRRFRHTRRAGVRTDGRTGLVFVQGGLPDARKRQGASGRRLLQPSLQGGQQLLLVWQRREGKDRQSASRHGLFSGFWPGKGTRHDDQRVELQIAFILADAAW